MEFEWNPDKSKTNLKKHGISFHEAPTVFGGPLPITFNNTDYFNTRAKHERRQKWQNVNVWQDVRFLTTK